MEDFKERPSLEQMVAELYARVTSLESRLNAVEKEEKVGGVYLDGVPEHYREFIAEKRKSRSEE